MLEISYRIDPRISINDVELMKWEEVKINRL